MSYQLYIHRPPTLLSESIMILDKKSIQNFSQRTSKKENTSDLGIDGRIQLKRILGEQGEGLD